MAQNKSSYPLINQQTEQKLIQANLEITQHSFEPGTLILQKGEIAEQFHIILIGQARVFIEQGRKVQLALLTNTQFFGEMSCLTGDPISANVEAVDHVKTISMNRQGMLLLMDENSDFRMQVIEAMVKRIQNSNERVLEEYQKNVLLMQHHETSEQERYGEIIGNSAPIERVLKEIGIIANQKSHVEIIGEPGTEKVSASRKIHDTSRPHYPFILLDAQDIDLNTWGSKIQMADGGTIAIENAETLPFDVSCKLIEQARETRLIFLTIKPLSLPRVTTLHLPALRERVEDIPLLAKHFAVKAGALEAETALSSDALRLVSLYPFLTNNVDELRELITDAYLLSEGRTIIGSHLRFGRNKKPGERPKIGLALGSGSARGTAHLGVLRILEEEKIPVDLIAGTSAGSLIGGAYASGISINESIDIMTHLKWGQIVRPTFPKHSFVHNTPMIKVIEQHLGVRNIEDLPIPFAAVASDVATGEAHIIKSGSLAHAISASTAIPSIIRPVQYQGKTLIDGAVVHPVPAALVKSMGADIVIAVDVSSQKFATGTTRHFIDSLLNTIDMMSAKIVKEELQLADVILRPDLGANQISFKDTPFCVEAGVTITRAHIEKIKQKIETY